MWRYLLLLFVFFFASGSAQDLNLKPQASDPAEKQTKAAYCPEYTELVYDPKTNLWSTGDWKSLSPSFSNALTGFQGAQWVGVNMGKIICIYKGANQFSFPVTVQNSTLVESPQGEHWGPYIDGRKNCHAISGVKDCPFLIKEDKQTEDIYQSLDFLKNKPRVE